MATISSIALKNFKGVTETQLEFDKKNQCPVTTLIGLNESGKTTILEGVSHFISGDSAVSNLFGGNRSKSSISALIPVHKKAAFNGKVSICGRISLSDEDIEAVCKDLEAAKFHLDKSSLPRKFEITRSYIFTDSNHETSESIWDISFSAKPNKAKKFRIYNGKDRDKIDPWDIVTDTIQERIPRIAYFPTFLVDMPSKIYLSEHDDETPVNRYYRTVLQDILDSINEGLSLEKHVAQRISEYKKSDGSSWIAVFLGGPSKGTIDAVFQKISSAVTKAVIGSWHRVFQRPISAKNVAIEWSIDPQKNDIPYASFVISDGESLYKVSERSLGFRWFFSFLLFTAFKQKTTKSTVFVFDEPAANLHAKAQAELLTSFSRIVEGGHRIIYSTHSHHMINPKWLSGAYIVENTALDYDSPEETFGLTAAPTNIMATPYRHFVSQNPGRTSYFQPVIEKLEYVTPKLIGSPPYLIVEGITDYYALILAQIYSQKNRSISLMPGVGAGSSGPLISLLMGYGERFLLLLDDDKAGRSSAEQYISGWHLSPQVVATLEDIDKHWTNSKLETLITKDTLSMIQSGLQKETKPSKKEIGLYLAEMAATNKPSLCFCQKTQQNLERILDYAESIWTK